MYWPRISNPLLSIYLSSPTLSFPRIFKSHNSRQDLNFTLSSLLSTNFKSMEKRQSSIALPLLIDWILNEFNNNSRGDSNRRRETHTISHVYIILYHTLYFCSHPHQYNHILLHIDFSITLYNITLHFFTNFHYFFSFDYNVLSKGN